jgi:hypothetical protein
MIIFHHNDMDGRCAAAIARKWGSLQGDDAIELIEVDYNKPAPIHRVKQGIWSSSLISASNRMS